MKSDVQESGRLVLHHRSTQPPTEEVSHISPHKVSFLRHQAQRNSPHGMEAPLRSRHLQVVLGPLHLPHHRLHPCQEPRAPLEDFLVQPL